MSKVHLPWTIKSLNVRKACDGCILCEREREREREAVGWNKRSFPYNDFLLKFQWYPKPRVSCGGWGITSSHQTWPTSLVSSSIKQGWDVIGFKLFNLGLYLDFNWSSLDLNSINYKDVPIAKMIKILWFFFIKE